MILAQKKKNFTTRNKRIASKLKVWQESIKLIDLKEHAVFLIWNSLDSIYQISENII